ncbi:MAG: MFS transporter [Betaproteobacteria bacterium]|jgi:fucose permease
MPLLDPAALTRSRGATRLQFLVLGVLMGAWGAHIPAIKAHHDLSDGSLSAVLLAAALGAVSSLFTAGRVVARLGARRTAAGAAVLGGCLLGSVLAFQGLPLLLLQVLVLGACMSLFDVALNTEGTMLERLGGRPVMSQLHGMFSVGGMLGAGAVAALLGVGIAPAVQLWGLGLGVGLVALVAARGMLPGQGHDQGHEPGQERELRQDHAQGEGQPGVLRPAQQAHFAWPRGPLLVIGLLILAGMTAEGAMYDWCVLYLQQELGQPQSQAALGYAVFSASMALSRFGGDALRSRFEEATLLRWGATLAAAAMAVVLLSAHPVVAWVGFAVVGAGLAPVAPILFSAATRVPGVSPAAAIASVTSVGYSGFMLGPPLIGAIATGSSLTWALGVVVLACALLAWGSRMVRSKA